MPVRTKSAELRAFEEIVANSRVRRELLWLRAQQKQYDDQVVHLEQIDPGIRARLSASGFDVGETPDESPRERSERFGLLLERCYARHIRAARESSRLREAHE
jgi:hypothetical protein